MARVKANKSLDEAEAAVPPAQVVLPENEPEEPLQAHALSDRMFRFLPAAIKKRWPQMRAVVIAFHVVALLFLGFPAPAGVMTRSAWKEPSVQNEMRIWSERANTIGFSFTPQSFENLLWDFSKSFLKVRGVVLKPFRPYATYFGVRQDWRMFSAPHRYPSRVHIDVREDGRWRPIYVSRSDQYDWNRRLFDHHRIRRLGFLHAWKKYRSRYRTFTKFVARRAAADFPAADKVRVRFYKFRTPTPPERRSGKVALEGKFYNRREHDLDDIRKKLGLGRAPAQPLSQQPSHAPAAAESKP